MNIISKENVKCFAITLTAVMVGLYVHSKFVAPKIVVKK